MSQGNNPLSDVCVSSQNDAHLASGLQGVLARLFDILYPAAIIFGGIALAFSLRRSLQYGWHAIFILHILMYGVAITALLLRRRIPVLKIFYLLLFLISIDVVYSLYTMGLSGTGFLSVIFLCIFAGVFLGTRKGVISIAAGGLVAALIGAGICTGFIPVKPEMITNLTSPTMWIIQISCFMLYALPIIAVTNEMQKNLAEALKGSQKMNEQLQREIEMRITAEGALTESEAKYRNVVESSLAAFYIVQDGVFRFVNNQFCLISGYEHDEIVDKLGPMDLVHPDDAARIGERVAWRMDDINADISEYEFRVIKKDGAVITVKLLGRSLIFHGKPAACGTVINISREKTLESQLRQSQKMEAIGQLAGGIAHDFNNIVTAMTGFSTLLQKKMDPEDPLHHYINQILSASQKAANLTSSLLAFGRRQPVALKPLRINELIMGTEKLLRRLITEDIALTVELSDEDMTIMADSTQVDQILLNLVTNARDAMPHGGTLSISSEKTALGSKFISTHGFGIPGKYALITVTDTGHGMDERTREKVFDPFFTTKDIGKGTGLGLSTVYGIVKQHNGYITVTSKPDKGASFHIYLPETKLEVEQILSENIPARRGNEVILVAEDNEDVRTFVKEVLGEYGYGVIEAVDGDDALVKFHKHKEISLVVLDTIMPNKNGKEVYDAIKQVRPDIKTLFMSGYASDIVIDKGIVEDDLEFISKPLTPDTFLAKVGEVLDQGN